MKNYLEKMREYSWLASWAIWESENGEHFLKEADLKEDIDFSEYKNKLNPSNFVILGLNPGKLPNIETGVIYPRSRIDNFDVRPWSNFHNVGRSRDYLLAEAVMGTVLEGSYMTDLFPIYTSNSGEDIKKFIAKSDNKEALKKSIIEFDFEMDALFHNYETVRLICIGNDAYYYANEYLIENSLNLKLNKSYETYKFYHYSGMNRKVSSKVEKDNYYPKLFKQTINEYGLD